MKSTAFAIEEFASRRRQAQSDLEERLRPVVERALDRRQATGGWNEVLSAIEEAFGDEYEAEAGERGGRLPRGWKGQVRTTLRKTTRPGDEHTAERIAAWLATYVLSQATIAASVADDEELFLEWVDMRDERVRVPHRNTHGQQRPVGEMFDVDGVDMPYPGWPLAPIELWINCRCTLRPVLASEANEFALNERFVSEKPWDGSAGRFTPEQWKKSCILHVCDGMEKSCHKLPIREPGGALSRAGVHAAAARLNQVDAPSGAKASAKRALRGAYRQLGEEAPEGLRAQLSSGNPELTLDNADVSWGDLMEAWAVATSFAVPDSATAPSGNTSTVIVALPAEQSGVDDLGEEPAHVTLLYLGEVEDSVVERVQTLTEQAARHLEPFNASVSGTAMLGPDRAKVLLLEAHEFNVAKGMVEQDEMVESLLRSMDTFPNFVPHLTVTYDSDMPPEAEEVAEVTIDRLAVWHGDDQTEYPLDGEPAEPEAEENEPVDDESMTAAAEVRVPWYGVLAPEGVWSGDRRKFAEGSLRHRDLPLPLTWQKQSAEGHDGNVTVATIESIEKVDGEQRASGYFLAIPEANEVIDLIREFGRFGVSVDADDSTYDVDEDAEGVVFSDARVCSACIVPIPAFAEAWVALGTWDDHEAAGKEPPEYDVVPSDEEVAAAMEEFVDVAPGRTEDGPGWLTHPVDTDRLRDYWVRGPGAAKIAWGTPGDFDRCRANVAEYVKPQHINGYCANRHYDAMGRWPGRHGAAVETLDLNDTNPAEAISMVASIGHQAPAAWFTDPELPGPTPLTVTDDGRVYGHLATWGTCHIGFDGQCVDPPRNCLDRGNFLTGYVPLDDGGKAATGVISVGGGHANGRLGMRPAIEHYDSTSAACADVTAGYDDHGIWVAGWIRPGTDDEMVTALRASALSGDWRKVGYNPDGSVHLELVAALAVNVPGFGIPRTQVAASGEGQLSLVAAGIVPPKQSSASPTIDYDALAEAVASKITEAQQRREKMAALAARFEEA